LLKRHKKQFHEKDNKNFLGQIVIINNLRKKLHININFPHQIKNNIERITVAFNMAQIKDWDDISNLKWVNKKYNENNRD
jgi:hypothetical protein